MSRDPKTHLPAPIEGEILPPTHQRETGTLPMPYDPLRPVSPTHTAVWGIGALFYKFGMSRIADALVEQNRAADQLVRLYKTQDELTELRGRARNIAQIEQDAYEAKRLDLEIRAAKRELEREKFIEDSKVKREIEKLDREVLLSKKRNEARAERQIAAMRARAAVADQRKLTTVARREARAAQEISNAEIQKLVYDSLKARHDALAREADAHAIAKFADMMRRAGIDKPAAPSGAAMTYDEINDAFRVAVDDMRNRGATANEIAIASDLWARLKSREPT